MWWVFYISMYLKNKQKILTEPFVQRYVRKYLSELGYGQTEDLKNTDLHKQGVDIKVKNRKYGRYFLVEVKGDPSIKATSPGGWRSSALNSALGQIITRMKRDGRPGYKYGYKYGIGFPTSFKNMLIHKVPFDAFNKLNLYAFFVSPSGQVECYDWRGIRDEQKIREKKNKEK